MMATNKWLILIRHQPLLLSPTSDKLPSVFFPHIWTQMHRFSIHSFVREKKGGVWIPVQYKFGHITRETSQVWIKDLKMLLEKYENRPKKLLVRVEPHTSSYLKPQEP